MLGAFFSGRVKIKVLCSFDETIRWSRPLVYSFEALTDLYGLMRKKHSDKKKEYCLVFFLPGKSLDKVN